MASKYRMILHKYSNLLANWGFKIFTTTSGAEVLNLYNEQKIDLIVSDFELEGMSMSTFCSLIRQDENARHVPIIITCYNIADRIARAQLLGASAIVLKPINPIELLEVIGNHVGLNLIRGKRVEIKITVKLKRGGQEFICFTRDISNTGILIKSAYALNIGDRITCKFVLANSCSLIEAEGEVVRYMTDMECDDLYGINFISISAYHRKTIIDYINAPPNDHVTHKAIKSKSSLLDKKHGGELTLHMPEEE